MYFLFFICLSKTKEHPRVRIKQKTTEQVAEEFKRAIEKKSSDGRTIQEPEFMDYYADINATLPSEKEEYFIDVIYLKLKLYFFFLVGYPHLGYNNARELCLA